MSSNDDPLLTRVFRETEAFYLATKASYEESDYAAKYPLTELWKTQNMRVLLDIINNESDPAGKIRAIQDTFLYSVSTSDQEIKNWIIDWYLGYLNTRGISLESFDRTIQASQHSSPRISVSRDGRLLTPDFLRTLVLCLEIQESCRLPDHKFNVLELGAGYGGLARSLKLFHPGISYVIIDIPESLFFSSVFLRLNFPNSKCCYLTDPSCLNRPISEYDFVFVPTMFAESLIGSSFTLFCNTASLGEMKNSVIRYWMEFVQEKVEVKYFFGLNRFLNTIYPKHHREHQSFRLDENCCSVSFDSAWRILRWELEPAFAHCPYVETEVSRNLEIIAERSREGGIDKHDKQMLSRRLVEKVAKQDWFVYLEADNTMKLRDNILAPDLTMKGTLFALWESIRLDPNCVNVEMMLKYLGTLTRGKPFEEMFYYEDLLRSLSGRSSPPRPFPWTVFSIRNFIRWLNRAKVRFIRCLCSGYRSA